MTFPRCARAMSSFVLPAIVVWSIGCRHEAVTTPVAAAAGDPDAYETWDGPDGGTLAGVATLDVPPQLRGPAHGTMPPREGTHQVPAESRRATGLDGVLPDVVVYLADIHKGRAFDEHAEPALLNQRAMQFEPRIQLVPPGTDLEIRNSDPTSHNVRGVLEDTRETLFNYAMPLQDQRLHVTLLRPGRVNVMCDMKHGWMKATLVVMRHPYYAITNAQGRFELPRIPPGEYAVRAWHDTFGERTLRVTVKASETTQVTFAFSLS